MTSTARFLGMVLIGIAAMGVAHAEDLADVPEESTSAAEDARAYSAGSVDAIPAWFYVDCRGLSGASLTRCRDAIAGTLDPATLTPDSPFRLVLELGKVSAFGWRKAATTEEYLAYCVPLRPLFRKAKWYDTNGAQASRFAVFEASWARVKLHPRCSDFFGAGCAQPLPPAVFYGVDPNRE